LGEVCYFASMPVCNTAKTFTTHSAISNCSS
jgi:hypothetical protein